MKVCDYKPLYGFFDYDYPRATEGIYINGSIIPFEELFDDNPELELNFLQIDFLNLADNSAFRYYLGELQTIGEVIEVVRNCFDEYRAGGGSPFFWLHSVLNDIELNYDSYPAIYRGAMQTNLSEWLAFYEQSVMPETTSRQGNNIPVPQPDTTSEIISRILEPLRGAFITSNHIDKIINSMVEYLEGTTPPCIENESYDRSSILISNMEFYTPFKQLHHETALTMPMIAKVLHYYIRPNNGSQNGMKETAIIQNMKRKYSKVI